jgi:lysozyme
MLNADRRLSDAGLRLIQRCEGFRPRLYHDPIGLPTIGYGHLVRPEEQFDGVVLHEAEARALLVADAATAEEAVREAVRVPLSQSEFDALVSFTFNLGPGALRQSALLRKLNDGDRAGAAREFDRWVYAGGERLTGLIRRRAEERALFETGSTRLHVIDRADVEDAFAQAGMPAPSPLMLPFVAGLSGAAVGILWGMYRRHG